MRSAKQQRAQLLSVMRGKGANDDEIAEALQRGGYSPLAAYRHINWLSQESAARAYNELHNIDIGEAGYMTRQRLSRIETWPQSGAAPTVPELVGLAILYKTSPDRLISDTDILRFTAPERAALTASWVMQ